MSLARSIQDLGFYTRMTGYVGVGTMAVVGTMAIDLVMMAAIHKSAKEGQYFDVATELWTWHLLSNKNMDPLYLIILSPLTTVFAIGLSIAYEVPSIGLYLALVWALSLSLVVVGWGLEGLGKSVENNKFSFFSNSDAVEAQAEYVHVVKAEYQDLKPLEHVIEASAPALNGY